MRTGLMALVTALVCLNVFGECSEAEKKKLEEFDRDWGAAARRGDRAALNSIFADDYMDFSLTGPQGKAETIEANLRNVDTGSPAPTYDHYVISCTPVSAMITHRSTGTAPGGTTTSSRAIHVLEKRNGRWVVVYNAAHGLTAAGEILYMEHDWSDADRTRNIAWFEKHFDDDYFGISSRTGAMNDKKKDLEEMRGSKQSIDYAQASDMNVHMEGDTAVVTGVYHTRGKDEQGKAFDRKTRYTDIYVKRNGKWQVLGSQGTPITQ